MEGNKPIVVGIGELLWDVLPTGKKAGGAPINFVYHATQLGAEGYAISAVGKDELGEEMVQELDNNHIAHCIESVDYPTGTVEVTLEKGIPTYNIIENVAWDHIPVSSKAIEIVKEAKAICFGTLAQRNMDSQKALTELLSYAPEDALRFFDINIRQNYYSKELILDLLEKANILKINDEELEMLRPMMGLEGDYEVCCKALLEKYGLKYVILTAGSKFSAIYSTDENSVIGTPKVAVADTVGAGDSFSGAFVYSILAGKSLKEAHRKAVNTAAFVCSKEGAWPEYSK